MQTSFILHFLEQLQHNNNKDWMDSNREQYLQAKIYFEQLVIHTLEGLLTFDRSLAGVTPKACLFRINKNDFSKKGNHPIKGEWEQACRGVAATPLAPIISWCSSPGINQE